MGGFFVLYTFVGWEALSNYDFFLKFQDKALKKVGQLCSIWVPKQQVTLGYEDLGKWVEQWTGVSNISNSFTMYQAKVWIEWQVKRSIAYKFNFNVEETKDLVTAFLPTNSLVREGSFIRTAVGSNVSTWGDHILAVVRIEDLGAYKTLQRTYFLRPVVSAELNKLLDLGKES